MIKDITLGQYFAGRSVLHRADPRAKLLFALAYIVMLFFAKSAASFGFALLFTAFMVTISGVPFKVVIRSIKPLLFIILFTAVLNIFWTQGENLLFEWKFIKIYLEGVIFALFMAVRIILLVVGMSVALTYTTTPIALTDGIEALLNPLKKIKVPVHDFAMMMTIAMRFIPTLIEETDKIMDAQKARGADFENGGLIKKAKALIPILIPLFVSAFKRADDLAVAMECRCYRGGDGRTKLKQLRYSAADLVLVLLVAVFIGGIILCNIFLPYISI
ncbi:MAG: energy-coupling factor transporter transmembrane protein EcfT [Ruminococcaceae bacterium]|nr:energy-coupling factor transporter transmembrane protein EcfT [Oscillospiraceae bacterium]